MAMIDAERFMRRCAEDDAFRSEAYGTDSPAGFLEWIRSEGYAFSRHELEDTVRKFKLGAQDEEGAAFVEELGKWYEFMSGGYGNDSGSGQGDDAANRSSSCDPSFCASCGSSCHG